MVKRGQLVKKGGLVVLLDNTVAAADLKGNTEKLTAATGRLQRLKLEQSLILSGKSVPKDTNLSPLALDILSKKISQYRSKMNSFSSKLSKIDKEIAKARSDVKITGTQFELKKKIERAKKELYDKKVGSLLSFLQAQDATLAAE